MLAFLKRLFGRSWTPQQLRLEVSDQPASPRVEDPYAWLCPPRTVVDPAPWDKFWYDQLAHEVAGFGDIFVQDGDLVDAMRANGLSTILCVGHGLSLEAHALAWAGFDVTALDLSPFAMTVARETVPKDEFLAQLVGGRSRGANSNLQFVAGDLCDATCCPGPYDVVIERLTLQLFLEEERPAALQAVANRLASPGIFFSHTHDNRWKPPARPRHATESWFRAEGWSIWRCNDGAVTTRVAWLFTSTG